jgi:hypothetical protein
VQKEDSKMSEIAEVREVTKEEFLELVENYRSTKEPIKNVELYNIPLSDLDLSNISMCDCFFHGCSFTNVHFAKSKFRSCIFDQTNMKKVDFTDASLFDCKIRHLKMDDVDFVRCLLSGGSFNNVKFADSDFTDSDFTGESLTTDNLLSFSDCHFNDGCKFYGVEIKSPISMSSRQGVLVYCNYDYWHAGCFSGSTSKLIEELEAKKQGWQLVAYLSNMLMYANEPTMTDEMRSKIIKAHQRAVSKMQGGAE